MRGMTVSARMKDLVCRFARTGDIVVEGLRLTRPRTVPLPIICSSRGRTFVSGVIASSEDTRYAFHKD